MQFDQNVLAICKAKAKLMAEEALLVKQRKENVANLAEAFGLIYLTDDELRLAFENIVHQYHNR